MTKEVRLQNLVNDLAELEAHIARIAGRIGELPAAVDATARDFNAAGYSVRACNAGPVHLCIADAFVAAQQANSSLMNAHVALIAHACQCEPPIKLPQPKTEAGGR